MKKITIVLLSLMAASTAVFGWSKKSENSGNLGRMYVGLGGSADFQTVKVSNGANSVKKTCPGGSANLEFNVPILKPNVNVLKKVSWFGLDLTPFFNYSYLNFDAAQNGTASIPAFTSNVFTVGAGLTPYLNFETGLEYLKAIKPFGTAAFGYQWQCGESTGTSDANNVVYSIKGGVEFVITDMLSVSPYWLWSANNFENQPCTQSLGIEGTVWASDQIGISLFYNHSFDANMSSNTTFRGDTFGVMLKVGFVR